MKHWFCLSRLPNELADEVGSHFFCTKYTFNKSSYYRLKKIVATKGYSFFQAVIDVKTANYYISIGNNL